MAEENPNARLLAFSDGVIAVAITLLVLDIRLPEDFSHWSDAELLSALVALWPRLLAYLLSFFVIGNLWNSHRSKFEKITGSDARLCRSICFSCSPSGWSPSRQISSRKAAAHCRRRSMPRAWLFSGLSLIWLWDHALRAGPVDKSVSGEESRRHYMVVIVMVVVFAVSIDPALDPLRRFGEIFLDPDHPRQCRGALDRGAALVA